MSKNPTTYKTDLSPLQRKMVDIASLTHRHPPFAEVRWRQTFHVICEGDMIDTKPMRIMKENILPSTGQLVQEVDQDTN